MSKKLFILISILIVSTGLLVFLAYDNLETIFAQGDLIWVKTNNPSTGFDVAYSITSDDMYIYIAGWDYAPGDRQWRIEKRRKSDGVLERFETINPSEGIDAALSITSDDNYIYIGGQESSQWRIEKRRKLDLGLEWFKTVDPDTGSGTVYSITSDDTYLYIGGSDRPTNYQWRIEKRRKLDGVLEWFKTIDPSTGSDIIQSITSDADYLYIVGWDNTPGDRQWRIEKRRKLDLGLEWFKTINPSGGDDIATSITFDDTYIYIGGYDYSPGNYQWRIEKRRKSDGVLEWFETINPSGGIDAALSITSDDTYIYIGGIDSTPGNYQWRIEKRRKLDLGLEWFKTINPSTGSDIIQSITSDDTYIYIGGQDKSPGNYQWRIEKRFKKSPSIGSIKIQTLSGIIKLNVKAIRDADANDIVRVQMPGGITGVADMVTSADRNGSPVKIYLGATYGTMYWRKLD